MSSDCNNVSHPSAFYNSQANKNASAKLKPVRSISAEIMTIAE